MSTEDDGPDLDAAGSSTPVGTVGTPLDGESAAVQIHDLGVLWHDPFWLDSPVTTKELHAIVFWRIRNPQFDLNVSA